MECLRWAQIKSQMKKINNKTPDSVIACVGGGSNAIGTFYPLVDTNAEIIGVEAAGQGLKSNLHSAILFKKNSASAILRSPVSNVLSILVYFFMPNE